jgi:hypothetical protein
MFAEYIITSVMYIFFILFVCFIYLLDFFVPLEVELQHFDKPIIEDSHLL